MLDFWHQRFFQSQLELIKPRIAAGSTVRYSFVNFSRHFTKVHLFEGPDLGHSVIYYEGKVRKERWKGKRKNKHSTRQESNP